MVERPKRDNVKRRLELSPFRAALKFRPWVEIPAPVPCTPL